MTRNAKILFVVGAVFSIVAIIVCIAGYVTASAGVGVGFEIEGMTSATIDVGEYDGSWGYSVYIKDTEQSNCDSIFSATEVTDSDGAVVGMASFCNTWRTTEVTGDEWVANNDPPLSHMGNFYLNSDSNTSTLKVRGTYTIESSTHVWVVDDGEELGEAVGGLAAIGLMAIVGIILGVVGTILCCVGCCCMCT